MADQQSRDVQAPAGTRMIIASSRDVLLGFVESTNGRSGSPLYLKSNIPHHFYIHHAIYLNLFRIEARI